MIDKLRYFKYLAVLHIQNKYLIPVCRKSRFLSNIYYCFFSKEFGREHQKVLEGKYMHLSAMKKDQPNEFHLRRQVHRLEKGLIMKERRAVFAVDYILDAVNNYKIINNHLLHNNNGVDTGLLVWAGSVIQKYFESVGDNKTINKAREIFYSIEHYSKPEEHPVNYVPYFRNKAAISNVSFEDFHKLALQRRSVRWYQNKAVPRELIEQAVTAASLSPSACNRQPFEFRIYDSEEMKNLVGSVPMGIRPFYKGIPVFVVVVGKLSAYLSERDRHVIYIDGGLASMSFMLALETLGLSSVPINWPDIEELEKKMEKILKLMPDERPMMLIGLGYADPEGQIPFSQKKSPGNLIKYNLLQNP